MSGCRCGRDEPAHLCHWNAYTCPNEGKEFFYYDGHPFSVAGVTMKLSMNQTWACDEHRAQYEQMLREKGGPWLRG